jgi:hypothetical protein
MARYDSADILSRIKLALNRPTSDEALADADLYLFAGIAQEHVMAQLATICPEPMYSTLTLLTTADDGQTYTFGTDADGAAIAPYGHFELYPSLNAYPGGPLIEGTDFVFEGTAVRALFGGTMEAPYARFITPPHLLNASVAPTLKPLYARILIVDKACELAAEQRLKQSGDAYRASYSANLVRVLMSMKTSAFSQGRAQHIDSRPWYRSPDLG